ncbi:DegQ family serine endoprotease [Parasulfuritortus cantonensis]|uniref:Probable periplasmic serine endoprotease DegP-like n=1 Tax=Parasulfuritortus cantonensis TaxID=2528202 RepID=A0A4R1BDW4_9PROT|nr:DegQ family serine endoprotease [Parasulfuritortus cantonensis]TCJ15280.1 DegQ family serine endoprotease [Parasulfuritortus cantonensis]
MQAKFVNRVLPALGLLALVAAGYNWWTVRHGAHAAAPAVPAPIIQAVGGLPDFSAIAQAYGPSVVNITTASSGHNAQAADLDPDNPAFDFFRRFGIPVPRQDDGPRMAEGSGFIVSPDGIVLTNAHVVDASDEVTVRLTDKREFKAKVIGYDKPADVAVLRINAKGLPAVRLGDPAKLNVGEWVLAIGSPFGFDNSVTAGIVSAKARALPDENYVPFIQTDVAVNPGNSGGPLFNMKGEVVGINSQIYSRSGGYQGLSFAIPIDIAMKVEEQIVKHGKVVRGRIGAAIQDLNQDLADSFGLKNADGALVASVEHASPAEQAGLQPGDVVLAVNGRHLGSSRELPPLIADLAPGSSATLDVWRDHASRQVTVKIGELSSRTEVADAGNGEPGRLGLALRELGATDRARLHTDGRLAVVEASGAAARAGLQAGDIILAANGTPVRDVEQLRLMARKAGRHIALLIQRDDMKIFVPVNLG